MFYIILSVFVSFICSLLEAVILSATPAYITALKKKNKILYIKISSILDDIEKPLASILTLNTIAHTIGATGAGAEAQKLWGNKYLSIFSAILTFVILFFSEIIPKSIGARFWKSLLPMSPLILKPMILSSYPIVWISLKISKLLKGKSTLEVSRDEIPAMAELGLKSGVIHKSEFDQLISLINFTNVKLVDVLRNRDIVAGLDINLSIKQAIEEIRTNTYSRLMVFNKDKTKVLGYVMRKDILQSYIDNINIQIKNITNEIQILDYQTSAKTTFDSLLRKKAHIAAVSGAKNEFLGIVTLEDLIENLTGKLIFDEFDQD